LSLQSSAATPYLVMCRSEL